MHPGKIFCIGRNKTGTTSLEHALRGLGLQLGNQRQGELLLDDWARRDFRRIIELARSADAFQDIPFSLPFTYQALDAAFEGSKFILTVRASPLQWYESVVRFHSAIVGRSTPPRPVELAAFAYVHPGWLLKNQKIIYGVQDDSLYNRDVYMRHYVMHNLNVIDYFRFRPDQLLVLNIAESTAMARLCRFLEVDGAHLTMPHRNRSKA